MKAILTALFAGALFGVGLCVSGMTDPQNVIAFLDVAGAWSPKLAGVMIGAVLVHAAWLRLGVLRVASCAPSVAPRAGVDIALRSGAAVFGVGWGLAGYCPGPALVALGTGTLGPLVFVIAMLVGIVLGSKFKGSYSEQGQVREREPAAQRALEASSLR